MKKYITILISTVIISLPVLTLAKSDQAQGPSTQGTGNQGSPIQQGNKNSDTVTQYQNQNQVKNEGEEQQLNNSFKQQSETGQGAGLLQQRSSEVSKYVHELLNSETLTGGIGQQVRDFASNQNQSQQTMMQNLEKVQNRNRITKFFFGFDRNAILNMEEEMSTNQTRLLQLANIKDSVTDPEDQANLQAYIDSLGDQNLAMAQVVEEESQAKGIFGWIIDLLNNR